MATTIDHLSLHRRITVIRAFDDARGTPHTAGETGVISGIDLDWAAQEISIRWDRAGTEETMVFDLKSQSGPGNGRMKAYFEAGDLEIPGDPERRFIEGIGLVRTQPPDLPSLNNESVSGSDHPDAAIQRVHALAGRGRFAEAYEQLRLMAPAAGDLIGSALSELALKHVLDPTAGVYDWLRDRSINAWYSWGAQATSGGEGSARAVEIHRAMDRFQRLDRARTAAGLAE